MYFTSSVADISPVGTTFIVSRTMSSFNPLPFTLAYLTLHTHGLSLSESLLSNGLPPTPDTLHLGCSYHLHPSCFPSFHLGVLLGSKNKKKKQKKKLTKKLLIVFQINKHMWG